MRARASAADRSQPPLKGPAALRRRAVGSVAVARVALARDRAALRRRALEHALRGGGYLQDRRHSSVSDAPWIT
jgi:hypothetical protein